MPSKLTPAAQLADIRARIAQIQADIDGLAGQPLPAPDALARLDGWIAHNAARFDAFTTARSFTTASSHLLHVLEVKGGRTGENTVTVDLAPLVCAIFGTEVRRRLASAIEDQTTAPGPSMAERPALIERWNAALGGAERDEEAIIRAAEADGIRLARRPDAQPGIVLAF